MRAGLFKEEIKFLAPTTTRDGYGAKVITEYAPVITTRARIKYNNGSKVTENNEVYLYYTLTITVRSYHTILDDYLIEYNGHRYYIISKDTTQPDQIAITAGVVNE